MKRALLTGGTGFVGAHVASHLKAQGWDVQLIVRDAVRAPSEFRAFVHDGSTENMIRIFQQAKPNVVFHLASLFLASHAVSDVERLIQSNVLFSTQILEAMAATDIRRIVNTGTSWQHFEANDPDFHSVNLYAATKTAFEAILKWYVEAKGFSAITLKLYDTYGANDPRAKLIHLLLKTLKTGEPLSMSPGEQKIDLVYIDDVVSAFELAGLRVTQASSASNESFVVATERPVSIKDLVATIGQVAGHPLPVTFGGRPYREREVMTPWVLGQKLPGWTAKTDLETGIRLLLETHRQ